jgi:hypothetical protein
VEAAAVAAADATLSAAATPYDRDVLLALLAPSGLMGGRYARWQLARELLGEEWEADADDGAWLCWVMLSVG